MCTRPLLALNTAPARLVTPTMARAIATDQFTAITELTVLAPDHPRLLSLIAGACTMCEASIIGAQIFSTRDGRALDTFRLRRAFTSDEDEKVRATRIIDTVKQLLQGRRHVLIDLGKESRQNRRLRPFSLPAEVHVSNSLSEKFTVIEVMGLDRTGLLHQLTREISDLNLTIGSAHIGTYGEKAVDVFYVTDLTGHKIDSKGRQKKIHDALLAVFQVDGINDGLARNQLQGFGQHRRRQQHQAQQLQVFERQRDQHMVMQQVGGQGDPGQRAVLQGMHLPISGGHPSNEACPFGAERRRTLRQHAGNPGGAAHRHDRQSRLNRGQGPRQLHSVEFRHVDVGGGLGIPYHHDEAAPPDPMAYAAIVRRHVAGLGVRLILEPGRLIAGNAGILVTEMLAITDEGLQAKLSEHRAEIGAQ